MRKLTPDEARSQLAIDALDKIADIVLRYKPKAKSNPAVQRKRRRTILENKRAEK